MNSDLGTRRRNPQAGDSGGEGLGGTDQGKSTSSRHFGHLGFLTDTALWGYLSGEPKGDREREGLKGSDDGDGGGGVSIPLDDARKKAKKKREKERRHAKARQEGPGARSEPEAGPFRPPPETLPVRTGAEPAAVAVTATAPVPESQAPIVPGGKRNPVVAIAWNEAPRPYGVARAPGDPSAPKKTTAGLLPPLPQGVRGRDGEESDDGSGGGDDVLTRGDGAEGGEESDDVLGGGFEVVELGGRRGDSIDAETAARPLHPRAETKGLRKLLMHAVLLVAFAVYGALNVALARCTLYILTGSYAYEFGKLPLCKRLCFGDGVIFVIAFALGAVAYAICNAVFRWWTKNLVLRAMSYATVSSGATT
jgi:hypothetical protein